MKAKTARIIVTLLFNKESFTFQAGSSCFLIIIGNSTRYPIIWVLITKHVYPNSQERLRTPLLH